MKYAIVNSEAPRNRVVIEHALGQYYFAGDEMYELVEVVGHQDGAWRQVFEWRRIYPTSG